MQRIHRIFSSLLIVLGVPGWVYLWLGSEASRARVLLFLAGYLALGVAITNRGWTGASHRHDAAFFPYDHLHDHGSPTT